MSHVARWISRSALVLAAALIVPACKSSSGGEGSGTIQFAGLTFTVVENVGGGLVTITVSRVDGGVGAVSAEYYTVDGTATAGADYTATSGTVFWGDGQTGTRTFTVPIANDAFNEGDETINLLLGNVTGGAGLGASAVLTITDDETAVAGAFQFSAAAYSVNEAGGTATITVNRSGSTAAAATVTYATSNGTATAGVGNDYTASGGVLSFGIGITSQTFTVPILVDAAAEGDETVTLTLSAPSLGSLGTLNPAVLTIVDDDALAGSFSFSSTTYTVTEGTPTVTATVLRTGGSTGAVSVQYASANGSAGAGDFTATGLQTLNFAAGETSKTFTVAITDDPADEPAETFSLTLSNAGGGAFLGSPIVSAVAILDNDVPTLTISDEAGPETNAGTFNGTFTVTLSIPSFQNVTVDWATSNGTAAAGSDYVAGSGTVTILAGNLTGTFDVVVNGDVLDENDETLFVTLSNAANATITDNQAIATLQNDDDPTIAIDDVVVTEGNAGTVTATFTATLSHLSIQAVTVNFATANATATAGADYVARTGQVLNIPAGNLTGTIAVTVNGDALDEIDETFQLNLSGAVNAAIADAQGIGTINDDDGPGITIADLPAIAEVAGNAVFTVTLSAASPQDVSVNYSTANGTLNPATLASDYSSAIGTLIIPAGNTTGQILVPILGDAVDEVDETLFVNLASPVDATITDPQAVGTIDDNDGPTITIDDVTATEGNAGTKTFTFTVTLSAASPQPVSVNFTTANGTAAQPSDYLTTSGTRTIPALSTTGTILVTVNGDTGGELNETFTVDLSSPVDGVFGDNQGLGTITNDDLPGMSISDGVLAEGNAGNTNMVFTVTLSSVPLVDVTVNFATSNGTATLANSDYVNTAGGLTFLASLSEISKQILVPIVGDTTDELSEVFTVTLSGEANATLVDGVAAGTITNDDDPTVSVNDVSLAEGTGGGPTSFTFTVTLSNISLQNVTMLVNTSPITTNGADLTALVNFPVTVTAGVLFNTFTVPVIADIDDEPTETFNVVLSGVANATVLDGTGLGTVQNDDDPVVSINGTSVTEGNAGNSTMIFSVNLSNTSNQDIQVNYTTADSGAVAGVDYTAATSFITILAGQPSGQIVIQVTGELVDEANENLQVTMTSVTNATLAPVAFQALGTINDDDGPTISINDVTQAEGNGGSSNFTFTVTLSALSPQPVTVTWATANGTAAAGSDYTGVGATLLVIPASTISGTFSVSVSGDTLGEANETFFVNLSGAINGTLADAQGQGNITTDDLPALSISAPAAAAEGNAATTPFTFTVNMTNTDVSNVTVNWTLLHGTTDAADFSAPLSGVATITAGLLSTNIVVNVNGDTGNELNETFSLSLSAPSANAQLGAPTSALATINNDDGPNITINDPVITEGNGGTQLMTFTVTLSTTFGSNITVNYATADNTATSADADFVSTSGTATVIAGNLTGTFTVTINGDTKFEPAESFSVNLSAPSAGTITDSLGSGTINNDDSTPQISIGDVTQAEGNGGTTNFNLSVTLSNASSSTVSATYNSAPGTADLSDYNIASGTVNFPPGTTGPQTITVQVLGDTTVEPNETFTVNLSAPSNGTILDGTGLVTITTDDGPSVTGVTPNNGTTNVNRGTHVVMTFSMPMNPATFTSGVGGTVSISPDPSGGAVATPILFFWNGAFDQCTMVFDTALPAGIHYDDLLADATLYTVTVNAGPTGVKSSAGTGNLELSATTARTFTTLLDSTQPLMPTIVPSLGAPVPIGTTVFTLTWNEPMNKTQGGVRIEGNPYLAEQQIGQAPGGTMTLAWNGPGTVLTVTLTAGLPAGDILRMQLQNFSDLAGNNVWFDGDENTFVTPNSSIADGTRPTVTCFYPVAGSTVGRDAEILIGFSEGIHPADVVSASAITVTTSTGTLPQLVRSMFDVPSVHIRGRRAWPASAQITVTVTTTLRDASGMTFLANQVFSFFTNAGDVVNPPVIDAPFCTLKNNDVDLNSGSFQEVFAFKNSSSNARVFFNEETFAPRDVSLFEKVSGIPVKGYLPTTENSRYNIEFDSNNSFRTFTGFNVSAGGTVYTLRYNTTLQNSVGVAPAAPISLDFTVRTTAGNSRPTLGHGDSEWITTPLGVEVDAQTWGNDSDGGTTLAVTLLDSPDAGFNPNVPNTGFNNFEYFSAAPEAALTTVGLHTTTWSMMDTPGGHTVTLASKNRIFNNTFYPTVGQLIVSNLTAAGTPTFTWPTPSLSIGHDILAMSISDASDNEVRFIILNRQATTYSIPVDRALPAGSYTFQVFYFSPGEGSFSGTGAGGGTAPKAFVVP